MAARQVGAGTGAPSGVPVGARLQKRGPYKTGYSDTEIENAKTLHKEHGWSMRKAAEQYGIPRTTFMDYLKGTVLCGKRLGRGVLFHSLADRENLSAEQSLYLRGLTQLVTHMKLAISMWQRGPEPTWLLFFFSFCDIWSFLCEYSNLLSCSIQFWQSL